jgi:hypothetical protein
MNLLCPCAVAFIAKPIAVLMTPHGGTPRALTHWLLRALLAAQSLPNSYGDPSQIIGLPAR